MTSPKQFENAGKTPGLQVWRVEKMDLKPIPKELYGEFFSGDSYIVLYTSESLSHSIHTWSGEDTSVDEKMGAAVFMVQLDCFFGGKPIQCTELQNEESSTFLGYFKPGVRYKKGGVASGLQHVVTNVSTVKRLLHVQGRRNIRAAEKDLSWSSFNSGDCFLIDLGTDIYLWSGSKSNRFEALKATEVAKEIQSNERCGRCDIHRIEEGAEPEAVIKLLGPKPELPESSCDVAVDAKNREIAALYLISDAAGSMKTALVGEKNPFKQEMLSNSDCYILDNFGNHKIFVWKGKNANMDERKAALSAANKFIKDKGYPSTTQVLIMPDGGEDALFKQYFVNWIDKYETTGPCQTFSMGRIWGKVIPYDPSTVHENKDMAAQHGMVDNGSGKVQIWRVEGGNKVPLDQSSYGQFFGGDCYLVLYTYSTGGKEKNIIYAWKGEKCTLGEFPASSLIKDCYDGVATQVCVSQGQEPAHLVSIFKKPLVIHLSGCKGGKDKPASNQRLFHIRQSSTKATRAVEVKPNASSLNTNDVFVLKSPKSMFTWVGKAGTPEQEEAAEYVVTLLGGTATRVAETKEPDDFWRALGGNKEYQTSLTRQETVKAPRLFGCSNKTGSLIRDEVSGNFTQQDLATDDVMLLDTWHQLFLWIGRDANEIEKTGSLKIAKEYIDTDPSGRCSIPINIIKQGEEPRSFTGWFHTWDEKMWNKDINQRINDLIKN
nr:scinderin like a isoform X2 [Solea senegalensis]